MTNRVRFLLNLRCSTHILCHSFNYLQFRLDLCDGHVVFWRLKEKKWFHFAKLLAVVVAAHGQTECMNLGRWQCRAKLTELMWSEKYDTSTSQNVHLYGFYLNDMHAYELWKCCAYDDLCAVSAGRRSPGCESRSNGNQRYRKTFSTLLFAAFDLATAPSVWVHYAVCHIVNKVFRLLSFTHSLVCCVRLYSVHFHSSVPHCISAPMLFPFSVPSKHRMRFSRTCLLACLCSRTYTRTPCR